MEAVDRVNRWCCTLFQGRCIGSTERGFSILLPEAPQFHFVLRHRAVDEEDMAKLATPVVVSVISDTGIDFCPWCGEQLVTFYKDLVVEQIRRAREK